MSPGADRSYRMEFYRAVDQRQGAEARARNYYVPIYQRTELGNHDVVATLRDAIDFTPGESVQLLSGFRGSGKTSELLRLRAELTAAGYTVAYLDIEDYINTELPIDLASFPVALAAGFASSLDASAHRLNAGTRLLNMLRRIRLEPSVSVTSPLGGFDLRAALRDAAGLRAQVADAMQNNRRALRETLHDFFRSTSVELSAEAGTVFLVDSIDHFRGRRATFHEVRTSVERLFSELAEDLSLPLLHVVYTVPVYLRSPLGLRHDVLNIKVADQRGAPYAPGVEAMRAVLAARAPGGDLDRLTGGATERLIAGSGGLFRDLLRLTGQVLLSARSLPVDDAIFLRAELAVRNDFQPTISREHVELLREVRRTNELIPSYDQWVAAMDLLSSGAVLRYPNGLTHWYDVHPLLRAWLD